MTSEPARPDTKTILFIIIIYAILLRPLCNYNALKQYTLLNGESSNLEADQREVITIDQTAWRYM